jgi:hypothetical protein
MWADGDSITMANLGDSFPLPVPAALPSALPLGARGQRRPGGGADGGDWKKR